MGRPPARSTCTDLEMRHSPNITATALSIPKPTIHPTIIRTTLRVPLDGVTAAAGACPNATCPAGGAPAGVTSAAENPVGAPQPWQNLVSGDSSAPHFEQKLAMGIPPVIGVIYHIKRPESPQFARILPAAWTDIARNEAGLLPM